MSNVVAIKKEAYRGHYSHDFISDELDVVIREAREAVKDYGPFDGEQAISVLEKLVVIFDLVNDNTRVVKEDER